jgi:hypothetical protein
MLNVTKMNRWFGPGFLAPVFSGDVVMTKTRLRQGTGVAYGAIATPWSGVQLQA